MDSARQTPDDAIIPAEAVRFAVHFDAIRTGQSPGAVTLAAPRPQLSDTEGKVDPAREGFFNLVQAGGFLGVGIMAVPMLAVFLMTDEPSIIGFWLLTCGVIGFFYGAAVGAVSWLIRWILFGK